MLQRMKNRALAKFMTLFPPLSKLLIRLYTPRESQDEIPWTPVIKPLRASMVAMVTTAGVLLSDQKPFDMHDPKGDPSFREIPSGRPPQDLIIVHDYYDHTDADRDINIVFPVDRLREFAQKGIIGQVAEHHYGFMGHVDGPHIPTLIHRTAPEVARRLKANGVDVVLLTPG